VILCANAKTWSETESKDAFLGFMSEYNKVYSSVQEMNHRYKIFKQSLTTIDQLQAKSESATFGITKFSDLTPAEFKEKYMMKRRSPMSISESEILKPKEGITAPTSFDWRDKGAVTPVKDQGQCGSCWAFSAVENIESVWILAGKSNASVLRLSEQQVVDCDTDDGGCDGGDTPTAYKYVIRAGGIENESDYPYTAQDGQCQFKKALVAATIANWKYATTSKDETTLKNNLVSWGPLSICLDAAYWQYYTGGVMTAWECAWINQLDHCVQLVGYDGEKSTPYWIVRNSWNTDWGVKGYIYLAMNQNTCGMTEEATSALV